MTLTLSSAALASCAEGSAPQGEDTYGSAATGSQQPAPLLSLPSPPLVNIIKYLSPKDQQALAATCRDARAPVHISKVLADPRRFHSRQWATFVTPPQGDNIPQGEMDHYVTRNYYFNDTMEKALSSLLITKYLVETQRINPYYETSPHYQANRDHKLFHLGTLNKLYDDLHKYNCTPDGERMNKDHPLTALIYFLQACEIRLTSNFSLNTLCIPAFLTELAADKNNKQERALLATIQVIMESGHTVIYNPDLYDPTDTLSEMPVIGRFFLSLRMCPHPEYAFSPQDSLNRTYLEIIYGLVNKPPQEILEFARQYFNFASQSDLTTRASLFSRSATLYNKYLEQAGDAVTNITTLYTAAANYNAAKYASDDTTKGTLYSKAATLYNKCLEQAGDTALAITFFHAAAANYHAAKYASGDTQKASLSLRSATLYNKCLEQAGDAVPSALLLYAADANYNAAKYASDATQKASLSLRSATLYNQHLEQAGDAVPSALLLYAADANYNAAKYASDDTQKAEYLAKGDEYKARATAQQEALAPQRGAAVAAAAVGPEPEAASRKRHRDDTAAEALSVLAAAAAAAEASEEEEEEEPHEKRARTE